MSDGPDRTIYRTKSPEMLALWDKWQAEADEYAAKRDTFLTEFAPAGCGAMVTKGFGVRIVGVSVGGWAKDPPEGWRLDRRNWTLVPYRKTARGKVIAKAMDAIRLPDARDELVGMPSFALIGLALCHPGVEMHSGAMYVVWTGEGPGAGIDGAVWEPVKLSEYYAVVEAETVSERPTGGTDG